MTSDEFFARFHKSAFRLEALPQYLGTSDPAFRAFCESRPLPLSERPTKQDWMRRVANACTQGKHIYRVHVLDQPLTPYLEYELASYPENVEAGEEVYIADRTGRPQLADLTEDFWLCDADSDRPFALLMDYDAEGRFVKGELSDAPAVIEKCRRQRDLALANSVLLDEYLSATAPTRS
jgi:Family of unknown function (DUF6879)